MDPKPDSWPSLSQSALGLVEHCEAHGVFFWTGLGADDGAIKSGKFELVGRGVQDVLWELDDFGLLVCYDDGRWALTESGLRLRCDLRGRNEVRLQAP
jgi:hypothetical protein